MGNNAPSPYSMHLANVGIICVEVTSMFKQLLLKQNEDIFTNTSKQIDLKIFVTSMFVSKHTLHEIFYNRSTGHYRFEMLHVLTVKLYNKSLWKGELS